MDHYGIVHTIHPKVPVYGSMGTGKLLEVSSIFLPDAPPLVGFHPVAENENFLIGPFSIRLHPVDHSAPHAMAILVRCDNQMIVYSGDLRGHGRNPELIDALANAGKDADALILEGTTIGQDINEHGYTNEQSVEDALVKVLQENAALVVVIASGQNLDRVVTSYRAAQSTGRDLILDTYQAYILHELKNYFPGAPQYNSPGVRVKFISSQVENLKRVGKMDFVYRLARASKVTRNQIADNPEKYIYLARGNDATTRLLYSLNQSANTVIVWSLWRGYYRKRNFISLYCERTGKAPLFIHSGGHATINDLQRFVAQMSPSVVIPIHTQHPEEYAAYFQMTWHLADGESFNLEGEKRK